MTPESRTPPLTPREEESMAAFALYEQRTATARALKTFAGLMSTLAIVAWVAALPALWLLFDQAFGR